MTVPQPRALSDMRRSWGYRSLQGAGAGILLTIGLSWDQLSPTHLDLFHRLLPINTIVCAIAVDLILASVLATLAFWLFDRIDGRGRSLLWVLVGGFLADRAVGGLITAQVLSWDRLSPLGAFFLASGVLLVLWVASRRIYAATVRGMRMTLLLLGFCIFWMLPVLLAGGFARQPWDATRIRKPVAPADAHPRVVWVLFDEMSWRQMFADRFPGLDLPNFDRLRAESVVFSNVQPDGFFTENVIPSLLLGKPILDTRASSAGWLFYRTQAHAPWTRFDPAATLFAEAQREGWTTGVAGTYNPYCRLLADQLDSCWMHLNDFPDHLSRDNSTLENVTAPLRAQWARLRRRPLATPTLAEVLAELVHEGTGMAADSTIDFSFLHVPLPHPPGFYDRRSGRIGPGGSYIDNLALSDRILGQVMEGVERSGAAARTTVIVSSDHSWRTFLWRNANGWTREDELASDHGVFDPRPMLIVRFPMGTAGDEIARPVPLLAMHDLLERILAGKIANPQQLEDWAEHQ